MDSTEAKPKLTIEALTDRLDALILDADAAGNLEREVAALSAAGTAILIGGRGLDEFIKVVMPFMTAASAAVAVQEALERVKPQARK